ncbi:MAG: hypothetical protein Tp152SUR00d2C52646391_57 [Prokaryotic dsDNA virus sp.]|nr:MAG: hypothetical protein Tp152SUR00d2C52646391_57 [Prokaryotic dsDNA virus sp.]|tara:strand:+ start:26734 stop:26907 length:174 start_codon:yes stop_codon:yes gene_type:complete
MTKYQQQCLELYKHLSESQLYSPDPAEFPLLARMYANGNKLAWNEYLNNRIVTTGKR